MTQKVPSIDHNTTEGGKNFFQTLLSTKTNKVIPDTSKSYSQLFSNDKSADTLNVEDPSTLRFHKERSSTSPKSREKIEGFQGSYIQKSTSIYYGNSQDNPKYTNTLSPIPEKEKEKTSGSRVSFAGITKMVGKMAKSAINDMSRSAGSRRSMFKNDDYERNLATAFKFLNVSNSQSPFLKILKQFIFFNIQIFIFCMNFISVINLVLISNFKKDSMDKSWEHFIIFTEWIVGINFGFEVLLTLLSARSLGQLVMSLISFEVISNILLVVEIVFTKVITDHIEKTQNPFWTILHILRSFKTIKLRMIITYTFKEFRKIMKNDKIKLESKNDDQSELKYFVYSSAVDIIIGIFIEASIYLAIDELCYYEGYVSSTSPNPNFTYIGAGYFAIVSLTTIGYGDLYPNYSFSRAYSILVLLFNISVLSSFISTMTEKLYQLSPYIRNFYYRNHIVIIGNLPLSFIKYFINELYQCDFLTSQVYKENSKSSNISKMILVGKENPQRDLEKWLENFSNDFVDVKYLKSNVLENLWHKQTNLAYARHLFAFSMNPHENQEQGAESDKQMAYTIQRVMNQFPKLDITLVLSTEFANQIKNDSLWARITIISAPILNEYIMANSLENQGLNIWLTHLATLREKNEVIQGADLNHLEEYAQNMSQEIYPIKFSQFFVGKTFQEVMKIIYFSCIDLSDSFSFDYNDIQEARRTLPNKAGILLLGIDQHHKEEIGLVSSKFVINPVDYKIQRDDIGYVVSYDQESAKVITTYTEKSSLYATYSKNMNLFKKLKIAEASNKYIDKMRVQMNEKLSDWKINKQKYFNRTHFNQISDFDSNLYEIPAFYDLYNNESPKGIFRNHIIIRGDLYRLKRITSVLRSYSERPIILFSEKEPNPSEWHKIRDYFKNIYYAYGNPTNINHLIQIDPKKAYKILILSSSNNNFVMDSESIIFTRIISDFFETRNFLTELMDENNLKYISINPKYEIQNYFFWPYFVRGSVHFSSLAMSIIAKSLNNKSWFSFIRNATKPNIERVPDEIQQNSKINTFVITPEVKKEFQFFGQMQYVLMSHDPPVMAIAVLKEKFTSQPKQNTIIIRQLTLNSMREKAKEREKEKEKKAAEIAVSTKKSFQFLTSHILKVMDNFYGSEFVMTNPSFLMPLDVGDKVLIIGNTRLDEGNEYYGKMISSSFRLSTPRERDRTVSNDQDDIFNFSLNQGAEISAHRQKIKKINTFKEKLDENLTNLNDFMKFVLNNWDDLHDKTKH